MRRYVYALALTAIAGVSFAAIGVGSGLPKSWTFKNGDRGYGTGASPVIAGDLANERNGASAMCVDCHTVNPSGKMLQVANSAAGSTGTGLANSGSHFVMNKAALAAVYGSTNSGGGNADSVGDAARDGGQFFRSGGWAATAWNGGGLSKFGNGTGFVSVLEGATGTTAAQADMICESCHSLTINEVNASADNDLLLGVYSDNAQDGLCAGCHGQNETIAVDNTAGRLDFHGNSNIKAFKATNRKDHHAMTGDTITIATAYPALPEDGLKWAPSFSTILGRGWCTPANKFNVAQRGTPATDIGATFDPTFRGECNITGVGTRQAAQVGPLGDIATSGSITCSNCHRPHNAKSGAGAHVFRMGDFASAPITPTTELTADYDGPAGTNALFTDATLTFYKGLRRSSDVSGKIYADYRALCLGCHVGY